MKYLKRLTILVVLFCVIGVYKGPQQAGAQSLKVQQDAGRAVITKSAAMKLLNSDHDVVLKMLDAAEMESSRLREGGQIDIDKLSKMKEFFKVFVDECHHAKEEDYLFPVLDRSGLDMDTGPIARMKKDHIEGRRVVRQLQSIIDNPAIESDPEQKTAQLLSQYVALIRDHIEYEDKTAFVVADLLINNEEKQALAGDFQYVEAEEIGGGVHERYHAMVKEMLGQ